jgi:hypothetical protein
MVYLGFRASHSIWDSDRGLRLEESATGAPYYSLGQRPKKNYQNLEALKV